MHYSSIVHGGDNREQRPGRRAPKVAKVTISLAGLPDALNGLRIAQIGDIHVGAIIKPRFSSASLQR